MRGVHAEPGKAENFGCPEKQRARIAQGKIEILEAIFFATGKDVIEKRSHAVLEDVAKILLKHAHVRIRVEGHTDSQRALKSNMTLSERRAAAVKRFLEERGGDASRLESQGFGPTQPIETNKTAAGRAKSRRVVFSIIENANDGATDVRSNTPSKRGK